MLASLLKALYARALARYMHLHPRAVWYLINTALNYRTIPTPGKSGGIYRALTVRRHQTTVIIRRERHGCTLMIWGPGRHPRGVSGTTDFVDIITRTRARRGRQRLGHGPLAPKPRSHRGSGAHSCP